MTKAETLCSLPVALGRAAAYATAAGSANFVSIFADASKKSWIDWLKR